MAKKANWFPSRREDQLAMAKVWYEVLKTEGKAWGINDNELAKLHDLILDGAEALEKAVLAQGRDPYLNSLAKEAFWEQEVWMRYTKKRNFTDPPLKDSDFIRLSLKPPDKTKTTIPIPTGKARVHAVLTEGKSAVGVRLEDDDTTSLDPRSNHGYRVYYGVLPTGKEGEVITTAHHYISRVPQTGEELPKSFFTRRKRDKIFFPQEDSGKTVYLSVCYENPGGKSGPHGELESTIIP
jgi:hypothetical protein